MDWETEGQHTARPHLGNGLSTHTTRLAASKKTRTTLSQKILGLQRRTVNRWWNAPERTEVNHTRGTSRGVSKPSARRPSLSKQGTGECKTTYVLDRNWCGHWRLHQVLPGVYQKVSGTQGAPPASWHSRGSLEETWYWLFCLRWQLICLDLWLLLEIPFLYRAKTSFWSLRDRLIDLFSIEGYPDEIVSDNGPPFQSKEFAKFLSGLGIKHTTSSPGYPRSNGFIERHIQTVKNMLSKSSNTRSFQEVLADLRTTRIGAGLPSPAEILHGRNLTTRVQAEIDIKAIHSVLQERQLKMTLDHDTSRRAKKGRPLVVGERCHVLGPGNKWIDTFVTGITDSGTSYETQVEATRKQFTRNRSHIRPRSPDIPHIHASFLQRKAVPPGTSDGNTPSERQNSVISGCQQLANGQKTVLSANRKGSIKQTNTSQVLVSETVPDRRVQPSRQAKMTRFGDNPVTSTVPIPPRRQPGQDTSTRNRREFKLNVTDPDLLIPIKQTVVTTRHSDLREPQLSSSDSQPASSQPVSETTTSKSSVSLPSSPSGSSSSESTSTSGTDSSSSSSETSSESSSQPSLNASSPETSSSASTSRSTSPKLLEMECSFNSLLAGTRDRQGHPVTRSQMDNLRDQQQRIAVLKQVASQPQKQTTACLSTSSCKYATSPVSPKTSKWQGVYEAGAGRECQCSS